MNATLNEKLWERTKTAFIFTAIVFSLLYFSVIGNYIFLGLVAMLSYLELFKLKNPVLDQYMFNGLMLAIILVLVYPILVTNMDIDAIPLSNWIIILVSLLYNLLAIVHLYYPLKWFNKNKFLNKHLEFYIIFPLVIAFIILNQQPHFDRFIFKIILLIWCCDSFAYLVGSRIGKNKLFPRISPNKTIEGSLGAGVLTVISGILMSLFFDDRSMFFWIIISLIVWIFGTYGDLVQSSIKRELGVKDTGTIMPGHGGFLDRFDSFIFIWPFIAVVLLILDT